MALLMGLMCRCGHPMSHHDANECWTNPDGSESDTNTCPCGWWAEVPGSDDTAYKREHN